MNTQVERRRIFSHLTKTRFLHIEDSLALGKLRFFIGSYDQGRGSNSTAYAFMDMLDARVVLSDLSWGKTVSFKDFKGGRNGHGEAISRVLKIQTKDEKVWIELQNGSGEFSAGVIKPHGPMTEISIPLTIFEGRKLGHACLAYFLAWDMFGMQLMPKVSD